MFVSVTVDRATGERAGAGGTFQVVEVQDENGRVLDDVVDHGTHYLSEDQLKGDLAKKLGADVDFEIVEQLDN